MSKNVDKIKKIKNQIIFNLILENENCFIDIIYTLRKIILFCEIDILFRKLQ